MKKKVLITVTVLSAIVASVVAWCLTHYKEYADPRADEDELF